jgi:hypothetical protein
MSNHFKAFDQLKDQGFFIGEFIWNFADFKTNQCMLYMTFFNYILILQIQFV